MEHTIALIECLVVCPVDEYYNDVGSAVADHTAEDIGGSSLVYKVNFGVEVTAVSLFSH